MLQKKLMIALCLFLISANVFSQNEETATVKGISDAVCDCMKSKNADYTSKEAVNNEFVACFSSSEILSMLLNYAKDKGIDVEDVEKMRGIGKLVGVQLITDNCTPFMVMVQSQAKETVQEKANKNAPIMVTGKLIRTEIKEFVSLVLQEKNNREITVIWLQPFTGSEKFKGENLEKMKNKNLKVKYQLKEAYLPKAGDYFQIKEIVSIEVIE